MDLTLTSEQELLASTAREFLEARCPGTHVREMADDPAGYSPDLWREIAELGWTGMTLPAAHGGADASFLDLSLVLEQMGRVQLPSPFLPTVVLGAMPVATFGTDDVQARLLPGVVSGEVVCTFGWSGPDAAWDLADVGVVASVDGDDLVLDGTIVFVPFAEVADHVLVVARHEAADPGELTAVVVPTDRPGITCAGLGTTGPMRQSQVTFEGVRVDRSWVLGDLHGGREVAEWMLARGSAALAAEMVGGAQRVLDMTVEYAGQRQQFGTPIGAFQAVQHRCADMAMDVLGARLATYEAVWRLAEDLDAATEVSVAKAWVSDAYRRVCAAGHQVHGAIGFTQEHDLHLYLRHAIDTELTFGDADHHLELVARGLGV